MSILHSIIMRIEKRIRFIFYRIRFKGALVIHKDAHVPKSTVIRIINGGKIIIGKNVELREFTILNASNGGTIELRENVFINDFSCINSQEYILIEENTQLGQAVKIYDHDHDYAVDDFKHAFRKNPVWIGSSSWLGSNVCVLRGSRIGNNCVIGAGTVVKECIEDNMLVYERKEKVTKTIKRRN